MKTSAKADLIIHPVRLRIIQAFAPRERLTAHQLAVRLSDVPQATLYRHLRTLVQGHVLAIAAVRQVRAIDQKVYALVDSAANVGPADYGIRGSSDHLRYFTTFLGLVRADFQRYLLQHPRRDLAKDGVAYYHIPLYMTDAEHRRLVAGLKALMSPLLARRSGRARKRRLVTIIAMLGVDGRHALPKELHSDAYKVAQANGG